MNIEEILDNFNDEKTASEFSPEDVQKNSVPVILAYLIPLLFFLPIVSDRNSLFCKFHANQSFTWFLLTAVLGVVKNIIKIFPIIGGIAGSVLGIAELAVAVSLMYGASQGKALRLPFVGEMINLF